VQLLRLENLNWLIKPGRTNRKSNYSLSQKTISVLMSQQLRWVLMSYESHSVNVHNVVVKSASTRWHRPLATFEYRRNPQEINWRGQKTAVKVYDIPLPPLKDSYWICMLGLFPNSPSLTQLNPVATAVCIRTLSHWTLSLSRIKMTLRTPQATRGEGNAATLPYFIRSFKPYCTPIALLSG
jgi:hypothetical protein